MKRYVVLRPLPRSTTESRSVDWYYAQVLTLRKKLLQAEMTASSQAQAEEYSSRSHQHALMSAQSEVSRLKSNVKMLQQQLTAAREQVQLHHVPFTDRWLLQVIIRNNLRRQASTDHE